MRSFLNIISKAENKKNVLILLIASAILLRLLYYLALSYVNPTGVLLHDSFDYLRLGKNIFNSGLFSREQSAPFYPEHIRVPAYPLLVGIWGDNYFGIIICQILLAGLNALLVFKILEILKVRQVIIVCCVALSVFSPVSLALSNAVLTETLSESFLLIAIYFIAIYFKNNNLISIVFSSFFLGMLLFTKPLYLWIIPIIAIYFLVKTKSVSSLLLIVFPAIIYLGWSYRNYNVFKTFFYANIDVQNLAFFRSAQIDAEFNGYSIELNQEIIRNKTSENLKTSFNKVYEHDTPIYYKKLREDALDKIFSHPLTFIKLNFVNAFKLVFNPANKLIYYQFRSNQEQLDARVRNFTFKEKVKSFFSNFSLLDTLLMIVSLVYSVICMGALIVGLIMLFSNSDKSFLVLISIFCLLIFLFSIGPEADCRLRYAFEPLAIILTGCFINNFKNDFTKKPD